MVIVGFEKILHETAEFAQVMRSSEDSTFNFVCVGAYFDAC
jgi:hypothetical protein